MSENFSDRNERLRNRLNSDVQSSADDVTDWINGPGGTVLGLVVIALIVWFVVGLVVG